MRYSKEGANRGVRSHRLDEFLGHRARIHWICLLFLCCSIIINHAEDLIPISQIKPANGFPVLDLKASTDEVTVRGGGIGWITYVVEGEDQGVCRTGRLDIDDADYRHLPRAGNAIVTEGNVVSVEGFGEDVILWSEALEAEIAAFGVAGNSLKLNESAVFFSDGISLLINETFLGRELARVFPERGLTAADVLTDLVKAVTAGAGQLTVWDVDSGSVSKRVVIGAEDGGSIQYLRFFDDGNRVVTSSMESSVEVWNLEEGAREHEFTVEGTIHSLDLSSDRADVLVSNSEGSVIILDLSNGTQRRASHHVHQVDRFNAPSSRR
jgi:hypothetical protein